MAISVQFYGLKLTALKAPSGSEKTPPSGLGWQLLYIIAIQKSLGIEVSAPRNRVFGEPLAISNIIPGSIAHRTGSLSAGDKLLAINNHKLDHCTISDAIQLLKNTGELVRLKIRKEDEEETGICFTVELKSNGGPLGCSAFIESSVIRFFQASR